MNIEYTTSFRDHGCYFQGELAVVRYYDHILNNEFNSASCSGGLYEVLDAATVLVRTHHPDAEILLDIPTLVCRISKLKVDAATADGVCSSQGVPIRNL